MYEENAEFWFFGAHRVKDFHSYLLLSWRRDGSKFIEAVLGVKEAFGLDCGNFELDVCFVIQNHEFKAGFKVK
jgi:hypothetical protein